MGKYINADHLRTFLQKKLESYKSKMVDPLKYPIDHIDLMALLAREYQALIIQIDSLQQAQQEVDLEKDIESWFFNEISSKINVEHTMYHYFQECARRYFELGKNSK